MSGQEGDGTPPGPVVAIDGPAGSGKSTVARRLAAVLSVPHLDTGAIYRAVALACLRAGVDPRDGEACGAVARSVTVDRRGGRTLLDGEDVEDAIRGEDVTAAVSTVAAHPEVRAALTPRQRSLAHERGGVVEGRDIGSVVLPDADLKVYLTATVEERARRRAGQLGEADHERLVDELARRDHEDASREAAPLTAAEDAWVLDTTGMEVEEVVEQVARRLRGGAEGEEPSEERAEEPHEERAEDPVEDLGGEPGEDLGEDRGEDLAEGPAGGRRLPRVAVVGRPNVGKSTLVNRILGQRAAIVDERPGITRDRTEHPAHWGGRSFVIVDTGGWEQGVEGLAGEVVAQSERAMQQADVVVLVVDVAVGAQEEDHRCAQLLRRGEVPVLLVANKADGPARELLAHELYGLGLGEPRAVSAKHGRGIGDLLDDIVAALPAPSPVGERDDRPRVPAVAIVGRPNVGKSSLFNRLLGETRAIVDAEPHTTRDALDARVMLDGEPWLVVDTAGLRRRYRQGEDVELYAVDRAREAVRRADLALFVLDGSERLTTQDQRIAAAVRDASCGIVLAVNKWDLVDDARRRDLERDLARLLRFVTWVPRVNVSALTGRGVRRLAPTLRGVWNGYVQELAPRQLQEVVAAATDRRPPPRHEGQRARVRHTEQVATAPPVIAVISDRPLPDPYRRYLAGELREHFDLLGVPVRVVDRRPG